MEIFCSRPFFWISSHLLQRVRIVIAVVDVVVIAVTITTTIIYALFTFSSFHTHICVYNNTYHTRHVYTYTYCKYTAHCFPIHNGVFAPSSRVVAQRKKRVRREKNIRKISNEIIIENHILLRDDTEYGEYRLYSVYSTYQYTRL